jgi:hypothetical protein
VRSAAGPPRPVRARRIPTYVHASGLADGNSRVCSTGIRVPGKGGDSRTGRPGVLGSRFPAPAAGERDRPLPHRAAVAHHRERPCHINSNHDPRRPERVVRSDAVQRHICTRQCGRRSPQARTSAQPQTLRRSRHHRIVPAQEEHSGLGPERSEHGPSRSCVDLKAASLVTAGSPPTRHVARSSPRSSTGASPAGWACPLSCREQ